jgi:tetratricopeptide (TPR) repeat protein
VRKPILTAALTLLAGIVFIAASGLSAFDLDDRHQCEDANRLANAGLLAKSRQRYEALLEDDPERGCAKKGLVKVATLECKSAGTLLSHGAVGKAEAIYERVAAEPRSLQPPKRECNARAGLREAIRRACRNVNPLLPLSRFEDAEERFIAILKAHPRALCAVDGLRRLTLLRCAAADALAARRLLEEAKSAYGKILESDSRAGCAVRGLAALAQPAGPA